MNLDLILILPNEIVNIIFNYISSRQKIFLNHNFYWQYNNLIDQIINRANYDSYIRDIIRNECIFVFTKILNRKFSHWIRNSNYRFGNVTYPNYVFYLMYYANKHNSYKINNILNQQFVLSGLKKKWIKSSKIINNRWTI